MTALAPDARFWDKVADRYAARPVRDQAAYRKKLEMTQGYLRPDMTVLEVGAGTGTTALHHAPHVAAYRATDLSPRMTQIAREKARAAGAANLTFETVAIEELEARAGGYDAVLAMSILHLMRDLDGTLARIHRLLAPGGLFVSSTICLGDGLRGMALVLAPLRLLGIVPAIRFLTRRGLERRLERAGFKIEQTWKPDGRAASGVFIVARKGA